MQKFITGERKCVACERKIFSVAPGGGQPPVLYFKHFAKQQVLVSKDFNVDSAYQTQLAKSKECNKQVYRRRYESRRSSKPKLH